MITSLKLFCDPQTICGFYCIQKSRCAIAPALDLHQLLDDFSYVSSTYSTSTLTDREFRTVFDSDWSD